MIRFRFRQSKTRDIKATQRLMRHKDVGTTLRVYVHDERELSQIVGIIKPIKVAAALQIVR